MRCTVTDMKGHAVTATATVTVTGGSAAPLTVSGVVRDEAGNPLEGAVVSNWKGAAPNAIAYGSVGFAGSGRTGADGRYVVLLPPGAEFTDVWDGLRKVPVSMPAECFHGGIGDACERLEVAEPGTYELTLLGYPDCPDCECDDDRRCSGSVGGEAVRATTRFEFPRPGGEPVDVGF